ncbi:MAG: two-component system, NarL family, nitrate/nitrite response regulator NarL [Gaiellaceae bacterium]|jgi:DNA-binding NarL/FixJ family response regulator|nr:two-component system, NarL family, nitrate/nitrite response regulator NarL [Gaiellaceae bacterium]
MSEAAKRETVLVADDHPPTRAGVRLALENGGFAVCAEVGDAVAAVDAAVRFRPDICLLDIHMPGSGIAAADEIGTRVPEAAVVMLTVSQEDDDLFDALEAGAIGYLLKDTSPLRLPEALRAVLRGEAALPPHLVTKVVSEFRQRRRRRRVSLPGRKPVDLTDREREVLAMMRDGLTTAEMAERLFVAPVTVRTHVAAILRKLRVPDRRAAVELLQR